MRIAQISDIHVLDPRFEERLLDAAIEEINAEEPDLVVVAGDLTANGYREEFEYARERLDADRGPEVRLRARQPRRAKRGLPALRGPVRRARPCHTVEAPEGPAQVVGVDSCKPDLDDGEIGRELYGWILDEFSGRGAADLRDAPPSGCDSWDRTRPQSGLGRR